jgi:hypothetical protein
MIYNLKVVVFDIDVLQLRDLRFVVTEDRLIRFMARREHWTVKGMTAGRERCYYLALSSAIALKPWRD